MSVASAPRGRPAGRHAELHGAGADRRQPVDARSDVFALGILAYELVTGRQPFVGEGWTAVMFQIMNVEPEPPTPRRSESARGRRRGARRERSRRTRRSGLATSPRSLRNCRRLRPRGACRQRLPGRPRGLESACRSTSAISRPSATSRRAARSPRSSGPVIAVVVLLVAVLRSWSIYRAELAAHAAPLARERRSPMATAAPPTEAPARADLATAVTAADRATDRARRRAEPTARPREADARADRRRSRHRRRRAVVATEADRRVAARVEPTAAPVVAAPAARRSGTARST